MSGLSRKKSGLSEILTELIKKMTGFSPKVSGLFQDPLVQRYVSISRNINAKLKPLSIVNIRFIPNTIRLTTFPPIQNLKPTNPVPDFGRGLNYWVYFTLNQAFK